MFRFGYDIFQGNAPGWYADVDRNLTKDNFNDALRIAKEEGKKCKESGDSDGEVLSAYAVVKALVAEEDFWNAKKFALDGLELAKGNDMKAAFTHILARIARKDRNAGDAKKLAETALEMYRELKNEKGELSVSITKAVIAIDKGDLLEAENQMNSLKEKAEALGDVRAKAAVLYVSCELNIKDELICSAVEALDAISDAYAALEDPLTVGIAMLMAAELQRCHEGDLQDAVDRGAAAARMFDEALDGNKKGDAVLCMAKAFHEAAQTQDSFEAASGALALFKATRNKDGQAEALRILADCGLKFGKDIKDVIYKMEEVAFLYRQLKNKKREADALNEVTKLQLHMVNASELAEPLRRARRAAQLYDEDYAENTLGNAEANLTVAQIYLKMDDDVDEALPFAQMAVEVFRKLDKKTEEANALTVLSRVNFACGDKDEGAQVADAAYECAKDVGDKNLEMMALDLVETQGKPKPPPTIEQSEIIMFVMDRRLAFFDEFESRRARYKAMPGKAEAKEGQPAIADASVDPQAITSAKSKVEYAIRWQRVANLDLSKMPIPKA